MSEPPTDQDCEYLQRAIELAQRCPPSTTAFSVGAVIVDAHDAVLATGYSREVDPRDHAEEAALGKLAPDDRRLDRATIYSSLEPCSTRASRPHSCTELILATSISRIDRHRVLGFKSLAESPDWAGKLDELLTQLRQEDPAD